MSDGKKPVVKKKSVKGYVDLAPALNKIDPQNNQSGAMNEDATGINQSRADYAIRLGLGDPDQLYYYRQCVMDPERAVQNPQLRPYVAEVTERALKLIFNDPQMWTRAQTLLRRMFPNQVAARMSEAAYNSLAKRARQTDTPVASLLEVWQRGYERGGEQAGWSRVTSFLDGGPNDSDMRENFELTATHRMATGVRFKAHGHDHADVARKVDAMRKSHPNHFITIHNRRSGMVHTLRKDQSYSPDLTEGRVVLNRIRRALGHKE